VTPGVDPDEHGDAKLAMGATLAPNPAAARTWCPARPLSTRGGGGEARGHGVTRIRHTAGMIPGNSGVGADRRPEPAGTVPTAPAAAPTTPAPGRPPRPDRRPAVLTVVADLIGGLDLDHPARVAVDGITAAGKTSFARRLAATLDRRGRPTAHLTMDGFHHPAATRHRQGRHSADGYYEDAYDLAGLRATVLDPLGPGGDRVYRTAILDLAADRPSDAPPVTAADDVVAIVDGSFLQRPELRGGWDLTIFLRCPFAAAEARGVARDAELLGGEDEARRLFRQRYHAAQRRYLADVDPERRADVVIDHTDPGAPTVLRVPGAGARAVP
jgi:uridine kinase